MTYTAEDFESLAKKMRYNLTALQAQLSDLKLMLASLPIPESKDPFVCPYCGGLSVLRNEKMLREHLENVHGEVAA